VLDRVADPGNLGTLLRSAQAFGWDGVYLIDGCCDPFNDKALRAAKGATFALPYAQGSFDRLQTLGSWQLMVADLKGRPPEQVAVGGPLALVLGNEAAGVQEAIRKQGTAVTLPTAAAVDSLNVSVAGGILMYLFRGGR
jgi:TrmH family RNA methyltransferase